MKKSVRSLSLALVFTLLAVITPLVSSGGMKVSAANGFNIDSNGVLTSYTGSETEVNIPDGVTAIGANAFSGNTSVTGVYLPISVKKIGESAFYGCSNLQNVLIGSGVETIENYAFNGCSKLEWLSLSYVKNIGQSVFMRCPALESLYIPTQTQSITVPFCSCPVSVSSYNQYFAEKDGVLFNKNFTIAIQKKYKAVDKGDKIEA